MATIKSYTDLQQSKVLAEILPLESADMYYLRVFGDTYDDNGEIIPISEDNSVPRVITNCEILYRKVDIFSCWSLAALLSVLPDTINGTEGYCRLTIDKEGDAYNISYDDILSEESIILYAEYSLIDACAAMIEKLHKLNLL